MYLHSQFCQKKNDFLSMSLGKEKQNKKKRFCTHRKNQSTFRCITVKFPNCLVFSNKGFWSFNKMFYSGKLCQFVNIISGLWLIVFISQVACDNYSLPVPSGTWRYEEESSTSFPTKETTLPPPPLPVDVRIVKSGQQQHYNHLPKNYNFVYTFTC